MRSFPFNHGSIALKALLCIAACFFAGFAAGFPIERREAATDFMAAAKLTLVSAICAASEEHPKATPFLAEISSIRPSHAYSVFLLSETGVVRCDVDAYCGEVLDGEESTVEDLDDLRQTVRRARVSLLQGASFAEQMTRAKSYRAELRSVEGKTRCLLRLISNGRVIEYPVDRLPPSESAQLVQRS